MPVVQEERRYLIKVSNRAKLLVLPIISALYFAWAVLVGSGYVPTPTIPLATWIKIGAGIFGFTILYLLLALISRAPPKPKRMKGKKRRASEMDEEEPRVLDLAAMEAPRARHALREEEVRVTRETHKGSRVLEISHPAKSRHRGGIYAKAVIPLADGWVLRTEALVAEAADAEMARAR